MEKLTFSEQYEINRPLREAACQEHYKTKPKRASIVDARNIKKSFGNWICKVETPQGEVFYTRTNFKEKWVRQGNIFGMWNELTLIEKN